MSAQQHRRHGTSHRFSDLSAEHRRFVASHDDMVHQRLAATERVCASCVARMDRRMKADGGKEREEGEEKEKEQEKGKKQKATSHYSTMTRKAKVPVHIPLQRREKKTQK